MYVYLDCYLYTIDDMEYEKDFHNYYNVFEINHDFFEIFHEKWPCNIGIRSFYMRKITINFYCFELIISQFKKSLPYSTSPSS